MFVNLPAHARMHARVRSADLHTFGALLCARLLCTANGGHLSPRRTTLMLQRHIP
jgi:hypothetical protein